MCFGFLDQEMDGEAISVAFAACPGPDCLRDVLPKLGQRLKVYKELKACLEASASSEVEVS